MVGPSTISIKYTDENYVTKQGFFAALGSSLVERLWEGVLGYRAANSTRTRLRTISQLPFVLTTTEVLRAKYQAFDAKLMELKAEYDKYENMVEEREKFQRNCIASCLQSAATFENVKISEPSIRAMVSGMYHDGAYEQIPVLGYAQFLKQEVGVGFPDCESFFADIFTALSGTEELVSFYRVNDSTVGMGRASDYAKYNDIESLEQNLEDFVSNDRIDTNAKALLSMYFVSYVEPFASHNNILAVSLAKKILSRGKLGDLAFYLPLERLLLNSPKFKEVFLETSKTGDFTYCFLYFIDVLTPLVSEMLNAMSSLRLETMRREYRSQPQEEKVKESKPVLTPVEPVSPKVEVTEVAPEKPTPVVEVEVAAKPQPAPAAEPEPEPVEEIVEEEESPEPIEEIQPKPNKIDEVQVLESLPLDDKAIFTPRASLNDKEVRMTARYIVETHPDINRQQALFFASHSIVGRYYTIQDYKKTMKVAYETARTSMDRLAMAKLYKKLRIKNKYVYTYNPPTKNGDKE